MDLFQAICLFICFILPIRISAQSLEFLTIIDRNEPMILFQTDIGIQIFQSNETCYDNFNSIYYPNTNQIKYLSYNSYDNYIVYEHSSTLCFKSLYKSEWNGIVKSNPQFKCKTLDPNYEFIVISHSRFAGYGIRSSSDEHILDIFSPLDPEKCRIDLLSHKFGSIVDFHITNFRNAKDAIFVIGRDYIHLISASGIYLKSTKLNKTDEYIAIDSDHTYKIFMAVKRDRLYHILRFNRRLDLEESIFNSADKILSISVCDGLLLVATLVDNFRPISLQIISTSNSGKLLYSYNCTGLAINNFKKAILVDPKMRTLPRNVCHDNSSICTEFGLIKSCSPDKIFEIVRQDKHEYDEAEKELDHKNRLCLILTIFSLIVLCLFQCLDKNKK